MEDVLDLYAEPYDPQRPVICFDERPTQLLGDRYPSEPPQAGQVRREDYQYTREGTANLFLMVQPLAGWREVEATERRTKLDFAECMRDLVDVHFPYALLIRVVLDNLNTHSPSALYEAFEPAEARRILRKIEFHFTPKHGSWLNMAEIELSILSRQCLGQRIPRLADLARITQQWTRGRNIHKAKIQWCFDLSNARTKLARLYS